MGWQHDPILDMRPYPEVVLDSALTLCWLSLSSLSWPYALQQAISFLQEVCKWPFVSFKMFASDM